MSEMSPLLRFVVWLTRLTIMVITALLVLLIGLYVGFHRDGLAGADWAVLSVMLFLVMLGLFLARGLGRALNEDRKDD